MPTTDRDEQEVFDDLERVCSSPGYVHVLAAIAVRDSMVSYAGAITPEVMAASYDPKRTVRTEFNTLFGLMMKHSVDFSEPSPDALRDMLAKSHALLEELHECLNRPMMDAIKGSLKARQAGIEVSADSIFGRGDVMREPIFYGGESAYSFQYLDFARKRYQSDDGWLRANKGFSIQQAHAVARAAGNLPARKLTEKISSKKTREQRNILSAFTLSEAEIAAESGVEPDAVRAVMESFLAPMAPANFQFQALGDFNIATAFPIIRSPDGSYISLQSYGIYEALYDSPFYWMQADANYRANASINRGEFTERFVEGRLRGVFGAARVHCGVIVKRGAKRVTDIDVLVTFADRAIVVQCKSKKFTLEARKGNDLQLQSDFKKSVQDAYDQAWISGEALSDPSVKLFGADGSEIKIPNLRAIYPVCVVSDHYPALTVQARNFLKFKTNDVICPPLISDVFLIDVLTEMLASPLRLLSYLDRRVTYSGRLSSINELTVLGYHLSQNLWFDDEHALVMIDEACAVDLDTAMTVRRERIGGSPTPKGILTQFSGTTVGRLLESIEHRESIGEIDLGFMLLTLSGETLKQLSKGLEAIAAQTRKDGLMHDFTQVFEHSSNGLTVHCSMLDNSEAASRLRDHCARRKYFHKATEWFGLSVRSDNGLPKFGMELRFPWEPDEAMEEATANFDIITKARMMKKVPSSPFGAKSKIGRNDLCLCGSGKKYKKCCINR